MTFGFAPGDAADGIVTTLTVEQAAVAVIADGVIFLEAENRPAGGDAEQSAKRANGAAPEAGEAEVKKKNKDEEQAEEEALTEMGLLETKNGGVEEEMNNADEKLKGKGDGVLSGLKSCADSIICGGEYGEAERAGEEGKGIEPADQAGA
jgi:hypothetical protein